MNCICIGSVNVEIPFSRSRLFLAPKDEAFLQKLVGKKIEIAQLSWLYKDIPGWTQIGTFKLIFTKRVAGRRRFTLETTEGIRFGGGGSALSIAVGLRGVGARVGLVTTLKETDRAYLYELIRGELRTANIRLLAFIGQHEVPSYTIIVYDVGDKYDRERSVEFMVKNPPLVTREAAHAALHTIRRERRVTHVVASGIRDSRELAFVADAFRIVRSANAAATTYFRPNASILASTETDNRALLEHIFRFTTVWQMNEHEAALYLEKSRFSSKDVATLAQRSKVPIVIVTRRDKGVSAMIRGAYVECPGYLLPTHDTAGAGDAFAVGFLFALNRRCTPREALQLGAFAAACKLVFTGSSNGLPKRQKLEEYLRSLRARA